jgi:hypothetical protein
VLEGLDNSKRAPGIIDRKHLLVRRGKVATGTATGEPVLDPRPARNAERELALARRQRDDLLGVDWETARSGRALAAPCTSRWPGRADCLARRQPGRARPARAVSPP